MTSNEIILAFVEAINAHDVSRLGKLMTNDHTFVDPYGSEVTGREPMLAGWRGYFEWFPDYQIEVNEIFENENEFGMFGFAGGSFKGNADRNGVSPQRGRRSCAKDKLRCGRSLPTRRFPSRQCPQVIEMLLTGRG
jgi:ketosteroid isomerase-like protein